ncbi:MAG: Ig-like domain-containing protein, partial [Nocardioidaceae bacterium]
ASAAPLPRSLGATTTVQAAEADTTTTTLEVTPASPADDATTTETLTATLDPATAQGTVQFNDGSSTLGDPVTLTNGTATTTTTLPSGEHSLTAVFTPTDTTASSGSTSNTVDDTVKGNRGDRHANRSNHRGTLGGWCRTVRHRDGCVRKAVGSGCDRFEVERR